MNFYRRKLNEIIAYDKEETSIDNEDKKLMEDSTAQYETYIEQPAVISSLELHMNIAEAK